MNNKKPVNITLAILVITIVVVSGYFVIVRMASELSQSAPVVPQTMDQIQVSEPTVPSEPSSVDDHLGTPISFVAVPTPDQAPLSGNPQTAVPASVLMKVTIMVPDDLASYEKAMFKFTDEGGTNPSKDWPFVKETLDVPYSADIVRASAQAAAGNTGTFGGPTQAVVAYLKILNGVAYVQLDIDLDHWAGVSHSINVIHPLVAKTLLQFPQIKNVIFGFAPGDSMESVAQ